MDNQQINKTTSHEKLRGDLPLTTPPSDRERERSGRDSNHSAKSTAMEIHGGGGGNETPLGPEASWSEEMERNEDKLNNEVPPMNNQRYQNNRNQRNPPNPGPPKNLLSGPNMGPPGRDNGGRKPPGGRQQFNAPPPISSQRIQDDQGYYNQLTPLKRGMTNNSSSNSGSNNTPDPLLPNNGADSSAKDQFPAKIGRFGDEKEGEKPASSSVTSSAPTIPAPNPILPAPSTTSHIPPLMSQIPELPSSMSNPDKTKDPDDKSGANKGGIKKMGVMGVGGGNVVVSGVESRGGRSAAGPTNSFERSNDANNVKGASFKKGRGGGDTGGDSYYGGGNEYYSGSGGRGEERERSHSGRRGGRGGPREVISSRAGRGGRAGKTFGVVGRGAAVSGRGERGGKRPKPSNVWSNDMKDDDPDYIDIDGGESNVFNVPTTAPGKKGNGTGTGEMETFSVDDIKNFNAEGNQEEKTEGAVKDGASASRGRRKDPQAGRQKYDNYQGNNYEDNYYEQYVPRGEPSRRGRGGGGRGGSEPVQRGRSYARYPRQTPTSIPTRGGGAGSGATVENNAAPPPAATPTPEMTAEQAASAQFEAVYAQVMEEQQIKEKENRRARGGGSVGGGVKREERDYKAERERGGGRGARGRGRGGRMKLR